MAKQIFIALAGVALLAVGLSAAYFARTLDQSQPAQPPAAPLVEVAFAEPVSSPPAIRETGFVRAYEQVDVTPEVASRVVEISEGFYLGARVSQGDLLVRLEARSIRINLMQAEADLESALAAEDQANARLQRQQELAADNFASEAELDRAQADAVAARAQVAQAEAAIEAAELRLEDTRLTAPFDALVVAETVSQGKLLQVGAPVGTLVASNIVEVRAGLSEQDFRTLRRGGDLVGRDVRIEGTDGQGVTGRIARVAPVLEGRARTVEIVAEVEDPFEKGRDLILNALVTVVIPLPQGDGTLYRLPAAALHGGDRLWRVGPDRTLQPVEATVQDRGDDRVFVVSDDLDPQDRILVTEVQTPLPGLSVRLRDASGRNGSDDAEADTP
ncbi:MAG: efflux RND transporter periplasmic adaptor subunit [Pelagibaca sp.]